MIDNSSDIKSQLLRLYRIALVDDEFSQLEWELLSSFANSRGVSDTELNDFLVNPVGKITYPQSESDKLEYLCELVNMIWIDGKVTDEERELFEKFYDNFGLPYDQKSLIIEEILHKKNKDLSNEELIDILLF
ncbi:hypothetical protein OAK67_02580 [Crocinitomicaceae bacterium]|nr:hypothetical protein [Crocinitomicaceae bacterium]